MQGENTEGYFVAKGVGETDVAPSTVSPRGGSDNSTVIGTASTAKVRSTGIFHFRSIQI